MDLIQFNFADGRIWSESKPSLTRDHLASGFNGNNSTLRK